MAGCANEYSGSFHHEQGGRTVLVLGAIRKRARKRKLKRVTDVRCVRNMAREASGQTHSAAHAEHQSQHRWPSNALTVLHAWRST